jgi:serine/threonine protein kinase
VVLDRGILEREYLIAIARLQPAQFNSLEYASPESLPSPHTRVLRQIDSKFDMWSLGMILHKMLFFKLPYRYATEGEATAYDEADKMDKLNSGLYWVR